MSSMDYADWNDRIAANFFNTEMAGRDVLLFVDRQLIESLGEATGSSVEDFISAAKTGPEWVTAEEICDEALQAYQDWRKRSLDYPPYIAYLALFVYAATIEGEFDVKAYYPRLRKLLGSRIDASTLHFKKMTDLWSDLEVWSKHDKAETLGRFTTRIRGGWRYVGIPLSQTLLSESERRNLHLIFSEAGLEPKDRPSDVALRRLLGKASRDLLTNRTRKLLATARDEQNPELLDALLDLVLNELSAWDPRGENQGVEGALLTTTAKPRDNLPALSRGAAQSQGADKARTTTVRARICLNVDELSRHVRSHLRIPTIETIPDGGLHLEFRGITYTCYEVSPGWSSSLRVRHDGPVTPMKASELDWSRGAVLTDTRNNWAVKIRGEPVRLFLPGEPESLPDPWIESQPLERSTEFLVACDGSATNSISEWGTTCDEFEALQVSGLPPGWTLFKGAGATESNREFNVLTLSTRQHIELRGGIKAGPGNVYVRFAPPAIAVEGRRSGDYVTLAGRRLTQLHETTQLWHIPPDAPVNKSLEIAVINDDDSEGIITTRSISLMEPSISESIQDEIAVDKMGHVIAAGASAAEAGYARGAVVYLPPDTKAPNLGTAIPTYLSSKIVFLGRVPGQIVDWPREELAKDWAPVWALVRHSCKDNKSRNRRCWQVLYCGSDFTKEDPKLRFGKNKAVKRWVSAVWINRKKNLPPEMGAIAHLWESYKEVAELV